MNDIVAAKGGGVSPIPNWIEIDEVSLRFVAAPDIESAQNMAQTLGMLKDGMPFYIGDFLNGSEETFGEAAAQIADLFGQEYDYGTLANYKSTCSRVSPEVRRNHPSMAHCSAVASLPAQEQVRWLKESFDAKMSVRALRDAIEAESNGELPEKQVDFLKLAGREADRLERLAAEAPTKRQLDLIHGAISMVREASKVDESVVIEEKDAAE